MKENDSIVQFPIRKTADFITFADSKHGLRFSIDWDGLISAVENNLLFYESIEDNHKQEEHSNSKSSEQIFFEKKLINLVNAIESIYSLLHQSNQIKSDEALPCISLCLEAVEIVHKLLEFDTNYIKPESRNGNDTLVRISIVSLFRRTAILHEKRLELADAISICETAISLGFKDDWTKTGMKGRLARLRKKLSKIQTE